MTEPAARINPAHFADAGVTDLNCRIVPLGEGREQIKASAERTREFLAGVAPAMRAGG